MPRGAPAWLAVAPPVTEAVGEPASAPGSGGGSVGQRRRRRAASYPPRWVIGVEDLRSRLRDDGARSRPPGRWASSAHPQPGVCRGDRVRHRPCRGDLTLGRRGHVAVATHWRCARFPGRGADRSVRSWWGLPWAGPWPRRFPPTGGLRGAVVSAPSPVSSATPSSPKACRCCGHCGASSPLRWCAAAGPGGPWSPSCARCLSSGGPTSSSASWASLPAQQGWRAP